jgi:predicted enzyme related to lactoylglutathione lyase
MANPNAGRFTWHELMTSDDVVATKFYTALFGWTVQEMDMGPGGVYRLFSKGDKQIAGGMKAPPGVPSHWLPYVATNDTDAAAKKLVELGGKVLVPPTDVPEMVRFAVGIDPQGAAIGVVKNISSRPDVPITDAAPLPGSFCWDELLTKDMDAASKYYGALFGWTGKLGEGEMKYWHWQNAGRDMGGVMTLMMPNVPPHWLGYIAVSDVEGSTAKVRELGGKVMMEPMDIAKVGKFSIVQDPTGATFALFRSARV